MTLPVLIIAETIPIAKTVTFTHFCVVVQSFSRARKMRGGNTNAVQTKHRVRKDRRKEAKEKHSRDEEDEEQERMRRQCTYAHSWNGTDQTNRNSQIRYNFWKHQRSPKYNHSSDNVERGAVPLNNVLFVVAFWERIVKTNAMSGKKER